MNIFDTYPQPTRDPAAPAYDRCCQWIVEAFDRVGTSTNMSAKLHRAFIRAGLRPPTTRMQAVIDNSATAEEWLRAVAELVIVLAPTMLSDIISEGTEDERVGVAYAAVHAWADPGSRSAAASSQMLQQLVPIATPKIWHAILDLFRLVDEIEPDENWTPLLSILADNLKGASSRESTFIVDRLQTLLPHQAILVGRIATALVENWRNDLGDIRTGTSAIAPDFVDIAMTLHRLGPGTRNIGTTLFEELLEVNAYSARATLDQIDNRFRGAASPQARRLPRRNRRPRRTPRTTSG